MYDDCIKLRAGDVVKFGRVRFRIKELVFSGVKEEVVDDVSSDGE